MGRKVRGRLTRFWALVRTGLAAGAASAASATGVAAQTVAAQEFSVARAAGTIEALTNFIERHPLSPEADQAFRAIAALSAGANPAPNLGGPVVEQGEAASSQAQRYAVDIY